MKLNKSPDDKLYFKYFFVSLGHRAMSLMGTRLYLLWFVACHSRTDCGECVPVDSQLVTGWGAQWGTWGTTEAGAYLTAAGTHVLVLEERLEQLRLFVKWCPEGPQGSNNSQGLQGIYLKNICHCAFMYYDNVIFTFWEISWYVNGLKQPWCSHEMVWCKNIALSWQINKSLHTQNPYPLIEE